MVSRATRARVGCAVVVLWLVKLGRSSALRVCVHMECTLRSKSTAPSAKKLFLVRNQRAELPHLHESYLLMTLNRAAMHERARRDVCVLNCMLSTGLRIIIYF